MIRDLDIDDGESLRRALLRDTFASVSNIEMEKAVLFTPSDREAELRALTPFPAVFLRQCGATLGDRMSAGIRDLLARGFDAVVMIGSDLPSLPPVHVRTALDVLVKRPDVLVLGPAEDGGYYLIGSTRCHPHVFDDIPWGMPDVLERTCSAAEGRQIAVERISPWYDVDSVSDLRRLARDIAGTDTIAPHTGAWLAAAPSEVRARVDSARMARRG